jgi:hypothetical protein
MNFHDLHLGSHSAGKVDQLIEENNQLLLLSLEALTGRLDRPHADLSPAFPLLQKLQKNLLHLALLAEQQRNKSPSQSVWTPTDLQRLQELIFTIGEDPVKLAQHLAKSVDTVNSMLRHLKG